MSGVSAATCSRPLTQAPGGPWGPVGPGGICPGLVDPTQRAVPDVSRRHTPSAMSGEVTFPFRIFALVTAPFFSSGSPTLARGTVAAAATLVPRRARRRALLRRGPWRARVASWVGASDDSRDVRRASGRTFRLRERPRPRLPSARESPRHHRPGTAACGYRDRPRKRRAPPGGDFGCWRTSARERRTPGCWRSSRGYRRSLRSTRRTPSRSRSPSWVQTPASRSPSGRRAAPCSSRPRLAGSTAPSTPCARQADGVRLRAGEESDAADGEAHPRARGRPGSSMRQMPSRSRSAMRSRRHRRATG